MAKEDKGVTRIGRITHRNATPAGGGVYHRDMRTSFWEYWDIYTVDTGQTGNSHHTKGRRFKESMFIQLPLDGKGFDDPRWID